ncbi:MAG: PAS domain S-box protein [Spirochaetes bacterium]|nr:PAS domain S-box protein [Spirochaetota bacterium]
MNKIINESDIKEIVRENKYLPDYNKVYNWKAIKRNNEELLISVRFKAFNKNQNKFIAIINDLAHYKNEEKKLRERQRLISTLISNLPGIVYLAELDTDRNLKFVSEGCYELLGFYPNDLVDNKEIVYDKLIHPDDKNYVQKQISDAINNNRPFLLVYRIIISDGNEKWVIDKGKPIFSNENELLAIGGFISDISDYKKIEKALQDEKERLSVTLRSIGDAVITTDINENVVLLNYSAENLTGWHNDEAFGRKLSEVFNVINEETKLSYKDLLNDILNQKIQNDINSNTIIISKTGIEKTISFNISPINDKEDNIVGIVIVFRDITEKIKIDEEIRKIQKLESLGVLAGGIAHDFNNLLTLILGNINLAKYYCENNKELLELLQSAEKGVYNSKNLTDQLLTFAKGGEPVKKIGSINNIIQESVSFALRGSNVIYQFFIDQNLSLIDFDEGQLNQVFSNLAINSRQAMSEGGILKVISENYTISPNNKYNLKPGNYIRIIFEDNGPGISQQIISKIFDPFFTTKSSGKGLGLATVYSIIKKHSGAIEVESKESEGTKFIIYLPASTKNNKKLTNNKLENALSVGKGKILYMDDEESILRIAQKILAKLGYEVDVASNGFTTVYKYKNALKNTSPYDCVILDLTIPGSVGGKETLEYLLKIDPNVKAIVTSGYSNDTILANYKDYGFKGAIKKPFTINNVGETLSSVLKKQ